MSTRIQRIAPCLWFDDQAEEAARFYTSIFPNSRLGRITRYPAAGQEVHHRPAGSVMTVEFELDGHSFTALNGGPLFKFNEALSLQVYCDTQAQIDHYRDRLTCGGDEKAQVCGWLKDRYGVSWQVVARAWAEFLSSADTAQAARAMSAIMQMKKPDIERVRRAYEGRA